MKVMTVKLLMKATHESNGIVEVWGENLIHTQIFTEFFGILI